MKLKRFIASFLFTDNNSDKMLSFVIYSLLIFGLIFTTSASIDAKANITSTIMNFVRQAAIIILCSMIYHHVSCRFSLEKTKISTVYLIAIIEFILLIAAVVWCYVFGDINGNYSWIYYSFFSFQPSELAKIVVVLVIACFLCDKRFNNIKSSFAILSKPVTIFIVYALIIALLQRDMGSALVFVLICSIVYLIPSHKLLTVSQVILVVLAVAGVGCYFFFLSEAGQQFLISINLNTIAARFAAVTNPSFTSDSSREIFYSLLGISKGGWLGVGLGDSVQKFGYLVSSDADYVFAIIVEEIGLLGILAVFVMYGILIGRLMHFARLVKKQADKAILVGAIAYLSIHFFLNIGGVSGLIPLTGVPLLLISKGGSATLSVLMILGMSQAVIANYNKQKIRMREYVK